MKTTKTFATLPEAVKELRNKFNAISVLAESNLIKTDAEIDLAKVIEDISEIKHLVKKGEATTPTTDHPYTYYFAVREHGTEGNERKEKVLERLAAFHVTKPIATAALKWTEEGYTTMFNVIG